MYYNKVRFAASGQSGGTYYEYKSCKNNSAAASSDKRQPAYFDTFRLDLLLDRLHHTVNALENVNRLRQFNLDTLSLPEAKPAPPQESAPDMSKMMESFGPMLNMLMNQK